MIYRRPSRDGEWTMMYLEAEGPGEPLRAVKDPWTKRNGDGADETFAMKTHRRLVSACNWPLRELPPR